MLSTKFLLPSLALCALFPLALVAQSSPLPDAPPTPKAALSLPSGPVYTPPPAGYVPKPPPKAPLICGGPVEGVHSQATNRMPEDLRGPVRSYMQNVYSRILTNWNQRPRHDLSNHMGQAHVVLVRFAIQPDGTFSQPEVTESSGNPRDDEKALAAIRDNDPFPPLPDGVRQAVTACMKFGYNTYSDDMQTTEDEPWLNKVVDNKQPDAKQTDTKGPDAK